MTGTKKWFKGKKNIWSNVFQYGKVYIFWKFIQCSIQWDKMQELQKFSKDKINLRKKVFFFFSQAQSSLSQLITVLILMCNCYMSWNTSFFSLKTCVGFSIFDLIFVLKMYFFSTESMNSLTVKTLFISKLKFRPSRPLFFKLHQEVLKFNDICVG